MSQILSHPAILRGLAARVEEVILETAIVDENWHGEFASDLAEFVASRLDQVSVDRATWRAADAMLACLSASDTLTLRNVPLHARNFYLTLAIKAIEAYEQALFGQVPTPDLDVAQRAWQWHQSQLAIYQERLARQTARALTDISGHTLEE